MFFCLPCHMASPRTSAEVIGPSSPLQFSTAEQTMMHPQLHLTSTQWVWCAVTPVESVTCSYFTFKDICVLILLQVNWSEEHILVIWQTWRCRGVVFPIFSPLADVILLQLTLRSCFWNYIAGCLQGAPHPSVTDTFPQMEPHLHQLLTNYHFGSFSELKIPGRMWLFINLTVMSFGSPSFGAQPGTIFDSPCTQ